MIDANQLVGRTLAAKYQLLRLVGQGGMGMVFEGRNLELGKRVAIKLIDGTDAQSAELAARLRREARAASSVESDAIVQVFDVGEDAEFGVFMVMEFLVGEDLAARIRREEKIDVATCVTIAYSVARALARAHAAGVVHRDLKPANVFLSVREDGSLQVKVLDFGISKIVEDDKKSHGGGLTRMGTAIGTPHYMSPEQAQGLPDIDGRADIWALGGVMYEMLTGASAYPELSTYEQTIVRILTTRAKPLIEAAPWVPPAVAAIVDRAMEHDIERRIQDAATFAGMLGELGAGARAGTSGSFAALSGPLSGLPGLSPSGPHVAIVPPSGVSVPEPIDLKATLPLNADVAAMYRMAPVIHGASSGATPPPSSQSAPRSTPGAAVSVDASFKSPSEIPDFRRSSSGLVWKLALLLVLIGGGAAAFFVVRGRTDAGRGDHAPAAGDDQASSKPASTEQLAVKPSAAPALPSTTPSASVATSATVSASARPSATTTHPTVAPTSPTHTRPTATATTPKPTATSTGTTTSPTGTATAPPTSTGIPTGTISTAYPE